MPWWTGTTTGCLLCSSADSSFPCPLCKEKKVSPDQDTSLSPGSLAALDTSFGEEDFASQCTSKAGLESDCPPPLPPTLSTSGESCTSPSAPKKPSHCRPGLKLVTAVVDNTGTGERNEAPTIATIEESGSTEESLHEEQTDNNAYLPPTLSTPDESCTGPSPPKKPNLSQVLKSVTPPPPLPPPELITQINKLSRANKMAVGKEISPPTECRPPSSSGQVSSLATPPPHSAEGQGVQVRAALPPPPPPPSLITQSNKFSRASRVPLGKENSPPTVCRPPSPTEQPQGGGGTPTTGGWQGRPRFGRYQSAVRTATLPATTSSGQGHTLATAAPPSAGQQCVQISAAVSPPSSPPLPTAAAPPLPLAGQYFALSGVGRRYESQLTYEIESLGGKVERGLCTDDDPDRAVKKTTVLISKRKHGNKFQAALQLRLPVVSPAWVHACTRANSLVDMTPYLLLSTESSSSTSDDDLCDPKDPPYIPGRRSPQSKPVFTTPHLHPRQVSTPGTFPAAGGDHGSPQRAGGSSTPSSAAQSVPRPARKRKTPYVKPPNNPLRYSVKDNEGRPIKFGTTKFVTVYATEGRLDPKTKRKYELEWEKLEQFVIEEYGQDQWNALLTSELSPETVSTYVATYLMSRINRKLWEEKEIMQHLDTTTFDLVWSKLVSQFRTHTSYDLYSDPFKDCRLARSQYMKDAKQVPGLGELAGQSIALTRSQISYLLHSDILNLDTPRGLVTLFYVLLTLYFLPRVGKETNDLTRGCFRKIFNSDGTVMAMVMTPKGCLKRDRGDKRGANAARVFKRPIALSMPSEPKVSFDIVYDVLCSHLDLLPWPTEDRSDQPLFYTPVSPVPRPGSCFFLNQYMGKTTKDSLLRQAIWSCGMDVHPKQLANQALRPTAFTIHKSLGLSTGLMMSLAGHSSARTHMTYIRKSVDLLSSASTSIQQALTGLTPRQPDQLQVDIVHQPSGLREVRKVKDFLPLVKDGKQVGVLPISGMSAAEIASHLPDLELVENDEEPDLQIILANDHPSFHDQSQEGQGATYRGGQ